MRSLWSNALLTLTALALLIVLPVWLQWGQNAAVLAAAGGFAAILLFNLFYMTRLLRWLSGPIDNAVPEGSGIWDLVFAGLHRRVRYRLEQQKALSEALDRFRRAVQALPDGIIIFNRHRQIDWINAQAETHFALNANSDRGLVLTNLLRQPEFIQYLDAGAFAEPLVLRNPRRPGTILLIQVVPYAEGENLLLSRDISHQERLETMRRDFVANVSHELKTPLTVVSGFAETLLDLGPELAPEQGQYYLGLIREQSDRMRRLIEDLLTLSALENSQNPEREEEVALTPLLESIRIEAEALSGGRHRISLEIRGPARLRGCASELRSAFTNLASNAVRYTPAGGEIRLGWQCDATGGAFSVRDTGIGVAPEHIPRLTERFYRVDRSRSRETGGTGLGLAIVKHVLNRHHAQLDITSRVGVGSCFTARFPERCLPDPA
ncbi:MAG: hypothetical protein RIR00_2280 [Pseudomonadota bacterium]